MGSIYGDEYLTDEQLDEQLVNREDAGDPYRANGINYAPNDIPIIPETEQERVAREQEELKMLQEQEKAKREALKLEELRQKNEQKVADLQDPNNPVITRSSGQPQPVQQEGQVQPELTPQQKLLQEFKNLQVQKDKDLSRSKWADLASTLGQGLSQYALTSGYGKAGANSGLYVQDPKLKQSKPQSYADMLALYKGKQADLKEQAKLLETDKRNYSDDPKSPESLRTYEEFKKLNIPMPEGLSQNQMVKLATGMTRIGGRREGIEWSKEQEKRRLEGLGIQKKAEERRQKAFKKKYQEEFEKDIVRKQKDIRKSVYHKTAAQIRSFMPQVDLALKAAERGEQTAMAILGVKMAKAMGEVGVLTDKDVTRYTEPTSLDEKGLALFKKYIQAKVTPEVAKSTRNLISGMKIKADDLINKSINEFSTELAKSQGISQEYAHYLLDYRIKSKNFGPPKEDMSEVEFRQMLQDRANKYIQSKQSQPKLSKKDKQAFEWAKANPNDPRAKQILLKLGRK